MTVPNKTLLSSGLRLNQLRRNHNSGFTLIELVMVTLLLSVLSVVAIPAYIDFRSDAKNATTHGALGAVRSAIGIAVAAIQLKEDPTATPPPPKYPTFTEMFANAFDSNHPVLSGTNIMDLQSGMPENPWTRSTAPISTRNRIYDCSAISKTTLLNAPNADRGWCYNETTGQIWANSDLNGGATTENNY